MVKPYLEQLSRELNETVDLGVLDGMHVLFIAQHPAPQRSLMVVSQVGARFPAFCTANGKALLAQLPPDEMKRRLPKRLEIPARHTLVNRKDLLAELDEVRATGLAYDCEEHHAGICGVGVAITDIDGSSASISVPMPAARFHEDPDTRHRGAPARARRDPGRPAQRLTPWGRGRAHPGARRSLVVAVVGSPRRGNTSTLVAAALAELEPRGAACETIVLGDLAIAPVPRARRVRPTSPSARSATTRRRRWTACTPPTASSSPVRSTTRTSPRR